MIPQMPPADRLREFTTEQLKNVSEAIETLARNLLDGEKPDRLLILLLLDLHRESCKEILCRSFPEEDPKNVLEIWNQQTTN